jgi:hypothetical protein
MAAGLGLFILALVNFSVMLNLTPRIGARQKWVVYLAVNALIAACFSFRSTSVQSMRSYLPGICSILMLINFLLFVLPRRIALR